MAFFNKKVADNKVSGKDMPGASQMDHYGAFGAESHLIGNAPEGGDGRVFLIDFENVHDDGLDGYGMLTDKDKVFFFYSVQIKTIPFERHVEMMSSKAQVEFIKTGKTAKNYLDFQLTTYLGYLLGKGEVGEIHIISKDHGFDSTVDFWLERGYRISREETIAGHEIVSGKKAAAKKAATKKETVKKPATKKETIKKPILKKAAEKAPEEKAEKTDIKVQAPAPAKEEPKKNLRNKPAPISQLSEGTRKEIRVAIKEENLVASAYTTVYRLFLNSGDKLAFNNSLVKAFGQEQGGRIYGSLKKQYSDYHAKEKENV